MTITLSNAQNVNVQSGGSSDAIQANTISAKETQLQDWEAQGQESLFPNVELHWLLW